MPYQLILDLLHQGSAALLLVDLVWVGSSRWSWNLRDIEAQQSVLYGQWCHYNAAAAACLCAGSVTPDVQIVMQRCWHAIADRDWPKK